MAASSYSILENGIDYVSQPRLARAALDEVLNYSGKGYECVYMFPFPRVVEADSLSSSFSQVGTSWQAGEAAQVGEHRAGGQVEAVEEGERPPDAVDVAGADQVGLKQLPYPLLVVVERLVFPRFLFFCFVPF